MKPTATGITPTTCHTTPTAATVTTGMVPTTSIPPGATMVTAAHTVLMPTGTTR